MRSRASRANFTSLAAMLAVPSGVKVEKVESVAKVRSGLDDAEDVAFLHDQQVFTVDLDLGARPLAEQDLVAGLDVERRHLAVLGLGASPGGDDFAFLRLFIGKSEEHTSELQSLMRISYAVFS